MSESLTAPKFSFFVLFGRHAAEIVMLDGVTAVYRSNVDLFFYVIGAQTENEVTLYL